MNQVKANHSRWIWLAALTAFGIFALASGRLLLGAGFLLLAAFAFFNNPLSATPSHVSRPTVLFGLSWACGILGVVAVLAAAARSWL